MTEHNEQNEEKPVAANYSVRKLMLQSLELFSSNDIAKETLKLAVMTLIGMLILFGIFYFGFFAQSKNFMEKFGWLMIDLIVALVVVSSSAWHWKNFQGMSCSSGMMVGMVQGMLTAFLIGIIFGVSNGMFVGSVIGIVLGMALGTWVGKSCGIMGVLEAEMAAFMAGPMGAMVSIMMVNDYYQVFIPFTIVLSTVFLGNTALSRSIEMNTPECCIVKRTARQDFLLFLGLNFIAFLILAGIMLYGPKSALFSITLN